MATANAARMAGAAGLIKPATKAALADLQAPGVVDQMPGWHCSRAVSYSADLAILNEGSEPIGAAA